MNNIVQQLIQVHSQRYNTGMKHQLIAGVLVKGILISKPQNNEFIGVNEEKTDIITLHAEVKALLNYYRKISNLHLNKGGIIFDPIKVRQYPKIDLIVIRLNKTGSLLNAKPCSVCLDVMRNFKVNKVYYSTDNQCLLHENVQSMTSNFLSSGSKFQRHSKICKRMGKKITLQHHINNQYTFIQENIH